MKRTIGVKARSTSILENSQGSENFVKYRSNSSLFLNMLPLPSIQPWSMASFTILFVNLWYLGHITFRTCNKFHKNVPVEGQIGCTRLIFDFLPWIFKCFPLQLGYFLQTVLQKQDNSHNHGVIICPWLKPPNAIFTRKTRKCLTYQSPT